MWTSVATFVFVCILLGFAIYAALVDEGIVKTEDKILKKLEHLEEEVHNLEKEP